MENIVKFVVGIIPILVITFLILWGALLSESEKIFLKIIKQKDQKTKENLEREYQKIFPNLLKIISLIREIKKNY